MTKSELIEYITEKQNQLPINHLEKLPLQWGNLSSLQFMIY